MHSESAGIIKDLDNYPPFPYDLIDTKKYHLGLVQTSRGCPFDCIFCSQRLITGRRFRYRSAENVIAELEFLIHDCQQESIMFVDDFFTANPKRVMELCALMRQRIKKKVSFGAQTRADVLTPEILREMRSAGFENLSFGFEASSDELLNMIGKKETLAQLIKGTHMAQQEGFNVEGVYIFGFPNESFEDRLRCFRMATKLDLGRARFNNLTPYPGTQIYHMAKESGKLIIQKDWQNFNSAGATSSLLGSGFVLPFVPDGTTDGALQGSVLLANTLFYLNPRKLLNMVTPTRKASGIGFEFTFRQLLQPVKIINFALAISTMGIRMLYRLITERECRRFLWAIVTNRLPELNISESAIEKPVKELQIVQTK